MSGGADRFDSGKTRHDLLPPFASEQLAKVYTMGAKKYAPNNWRKGMAWSRVIGSLKRHLNEIEKGNDFDDESGLHHAAHVAWNAVTLLEYYKIFPQGDDRAHNYLHFNPKIGLDIDEVLCDFMGGWARYWGTSHSSTESSTSEQPSTWYFDRDISQKFERMKNEGTLDDFYLDLQPLIDPKDIPFEPHCYVTSRPVDSSVTEKWLEMHGFPARPVYTVSLGSSKAEVLKSSGADIFVDDRYENFVDLNRNGICTFLYDANHNQRYNVGYKRIKSLKELL
jgi:5'(3')-deoxyribonucleotidase